MRPFGRWLIGMGSKLETESFGAKKESSGCSWQGGQKGGAVFTGNANSSLNSSASITKCKKFWEAYPREIGLHFSCYEVHDVALAQREEKKKGLSTPGYPALGDWDPSGSTRNVLFHRLTVVMAKKLLSNALQAPGMEGYKWAYSQIQKILPMASQIWGRGS